jgi:hypothetical protein
MRLPHERDESTHRPGEPGPVTKRAAKDLEDGQEDTDCYGAVGERFDRSVDEAEACDARRAFIVRERLRAMSLTVPETQATPGPDKRERPET